MADYFPRLRVTEVRSLDQNAMRNHISDLSVQLLVSPPDDDDKEDILVAGLYGDMLHVFDLENDNDERDPFEECAADSLFLYEVWKHCKVSEGHWDSGDSMEDPIFKVATVRRESPKHLSTAVMLFMISGWLRGLSDTLVVLNSGLFSLTELSAAGFRLIDAPTFRFACIHSNRQFDVNSLPVQELETLLSNQLK